MVQVNAVDKDGIPRVYGYAPTLKKAETECRWALTEYLQRRLDMTAKDFTFEVSC